MRPIFDKMNIEAKVIKCKECKNGKFYVLLQTTPCDTEFDLFSDTPFNVGEVVSLKLWRVVETKYFIRKDK